MIVYAKLGKQCCKISWLEGQQQELAPAQVTTQSSVLRQMGRHELPVQTEQFRLRICTEGRLDISFSVPQKRMRLESRVVDQLL